MPVILAVITSVPAKNGPLTDSVIIKPIPVYVLAESDLLQYIFSVYVVTKSLDTAYVYSYKLFHNVPLHKLLY